MIKTRRARARWLESNSGSSAAGVRRCLALLLLLLPTPALGQQIDLSHGGPITVTAVDGLEWRQNERVVIARGNARAVRGNVTVDADRLIAHYRKKANAPQSTPQPPPQPDKTGLEANADTSGNEIYRVEAEGHVLIYTPTDRAQGDHAIYDIDQAVLVMTGRDLKLTTPNDVLTARDTLEYWTQKHMAVARGDAVVVTNDGRRLAADTLVAYTTDAPHPGQAPQQATKVASKPGDKPSAEQDPLASGKLERVEAFGHVSIRTATDTVTGDRGVYVPDTGIARVGGHVRITRGQNQLNGSEAEVNLKTGVARLLSDPHERVQGLVLPNDATNRNTGAALLPDQPAQKGSRR